MKGISMNILRIVSDEDRKKLPPTIKEGKNDIMHISFGLSLCGVSFDRVEIQSIDNEPKLGEWINNVIVPRILPVKILEDDIGFKTDKGDELLTVNVTKVKEVFEGISKWLDKDKLL